ncbi:MAG: hypothetical protein ACJ76I_06545 [Gaiellaceae bacterium]
MGNNTVLTATCTCAAPVPVVRAAHKGAARTYCATCALPMKLDFGSR